MYIGNIRFLIIITLMFIPAIVIFIWSCKIKIRYQKKMLNQIKKRGNES